MSGLFTPWRPCTVMIRGPESGKFVEALPDGNLAAAASAGGTAFSFEDGRTTLTGSGVVFGTITATQRQAANVDQKVAVQESSASGSEFVPSTGIAHFSLFQPFLRSVATNGESHVDKPDEQHDAQTDFEHVLLPETEVFVKVQHQEAADGRSENLIQSTNQSAASQFHMVKVRPTRILHAGNAQQEFMRHAGPCKMSLDGTSGAAIASEGSEDAWLSVTERTQLAKVPVCCIAAASGLGSPLTSNAGIRDGTLFHPAFLFVEFEANNKPTEVGAPDANVGDEPPGANLLAAGGGGTVLHEHDRSHNQYRHTARSVIPTGSQVLLQAGAYGHTSLFANLKIRSSIANRSDFMYLLDAVTHEGMAGGAVSVRRRTSGDEQHEDRLIGLLLPPLKVGTIADGSGAGTAGSPGTSDAFSLAVALTSADAGGNGDRSLRSKMKLEAVMTCSGNEMMETLTTSTLEVHNLQPERSLKTTDPFFRRSVARLVHPDRGTWGTAVVLTTKPRAFFLTCAHVARDTRFMRVQLPPAQGMDSYVKRTSAEADLLQRHTAFVTIRKVWDGFTSGSGMDAALLVVDSTAQQKLVEECFEEVPWVTDETKMPLSRKDGSDRTTECAAVGFPVFEDQSLFQNFQPTVTKGLVSSVKLGNKTVMLRSTAAVHNGNSGGALVLPGRGLIGLLVMNIQRGGAPAIPDSSADAEQDEHDASASRKSEAEEGKDSLSSPQYYPHLNFSIPVWQKLSPIYHFCKNLKKKHLFEFTFFNRIEPMTQIEKQLWLLDENASAGLTLEDGQLQMKDVSKLEQRAAYARTVLNIFTNESRAARARL
ncbi:unnamed protein product [Amoebophrya sp. A120]|nr:unnamed protein product [Amoebophrya sp. A120]|eukprot:GSA120T00007743001.1